MSKELSEKEFKKLERSETDLEEENEKYKENLTEAYRNIIDILKDYLDLKEEYYNIVALWIIGTYFHDKFPSYPFLFFNAMKGSGKSRTINLITTLAKNGEILNALTEAVLFRTKGTLAIDEFEGVNRKGSENLRELLNSAYKKGAKVKRMKQQKTEKGTEMVVEEFDVYRPIVLANIWGMENVLGDRCITLVLEKSDKKTITNLVEIWKEEEIVKQTIQLLNQCSLCRCSFSLGTYKEWNSYVRNNYTIYTYYTNNTNNTNNTNTTNTVFKTIKEMDLNGRDLELSFPLCLVASEISDETLKITTLTLKEIFDEKKSNELVENMDISLYDFISMLPTPSNFYLIKELTDQFRMFSGNTDDWINSKWMGRALKRLNLRKEERRMGKGMSVLPDVEKAQEKMKMFR